MSIQLLIKESGVWQDRTAKLFQKAAPGFDLIRGSLGNCRFTFIIRAGDTYEVETGQPVMLKEGSATRFAGTIESHSRKWLGDEGFHVETVDVAPIEKCFDGQYCRPMVLTNVTPGEAIIAVFNANCTGMPVTLGTIQQGPLSSDSPAITLVIPSLVLKGTERVSDVFASLATEAGYICFVRHSDQTLQFGPETLVPSAITIHSDDVSHDFLWETPEYAKKRSDYRNRQILQVPFGIFAPSNEVFLGDGKATRFTLREPIDHLVEAKLTTSTQATATGTFTGQPNVGGTITVNDLTYTFVPALDNREFGQVLIGATVAESCTNLVDAINRKTSRTNGASPAVTIYLPGVTYSLPTWENGLCNADEPSSLAFTIRVKIPGDVGNNIPLSENCTNFSWGSSGGSGGGGGGGTVTWTTYGTVYEYATINVGQYAILNGVSYTFGGAGNVYVPGLYSQVAAQNFADAINGVYPGFTHNPDFQAGGVYSTGISGRLAYAFTLFLRDGATATITNVSNFQVAVVTPAAAGTTGTSAVLPDSGAGGNTNVAVQWSVGSQDITVLTAIPEGTSLTVSYYRLAADLIIVEDSAAVAVRAAIESGSGRYQQATTDSNIADAWAGLLKAQKILAQYSQFPATFSFETEVAGLAPGELLSITSIYPNGTSVILGGSWLIQEVHAVGQIRKLTGTYAAGFEKFRYSVQVSNAPVVSYVDFWERLALTDGGGAGGGVGAALVKPTGSNDTPMWVQEAPFGQRDGSNTTYFLNWVPATSPLTKNQIVNVTRNGVTLTPFVHGLEGYDLTAVGSPALSPEYSLSDNIITMTVPPVETDNLLALYIPGPKATIPVGPPIAIDLVVDVDWERSATDLAEASVVGWHWLYNPITAYYQYAEMVNILFPLITSPAGMPSGSAFGRKMISYSLTALQLAEVIANDPTFATFVLAGAAPTTSIAHEKPAYFINEGGNGVATLAVYDYYMKVTYASGYVERWRPQSYTATQSGTSTLSMGTAPVKWLFGCSTHFITPDWNGLTLFNFGRGSGV